MGKTKRYKNYLELTESGVEFKKGSTPLCHKVFYEGKEIGEVAKTIRNGRQVWVMYGWFGETREAAVSGYVSSGFEDVSTSEEPLPQPTFGEYDPTGMAFPNGDEVVGFWYIEDSIKWHLAIDKEGREYETSDQPVKGATPTVVTT